MQINGLRKILISYIIRTCQKSQFNSTYRGCHTKHQHRPIKKLLIANRGEIACRVIRTARKMGIQTVSVFSDPDKNSLHVAMADEAYYIGPAAAQESYLRSHKVLEAARDSRAHAIHPGYGFLSESAEFADECQRSGVIFIGPPASAIRDMGIKSTSKHIMSAAGVPIIGGYHGEDQCPERLLEEAKKIGFPVMIKAVRGGGGKGMRICTKESDFMNQLNSAKTEAMKSFGDEVMLIEKFVQRPRHIEVQVFGDKHRNYVYLFERDCSVQRRHQKIIEEAPAPGIDEEVRKRLGIAGVRAAQAVNYVGAGTVEFIMDPNQDFFFMEMNTRLQVEHPVSEMVTGVDLVEWQIRVAAGEPLLMTQDDFSLKGHSFEARIYAEDPNTNFLPGAGPLKRLAVPEPKPYLRIETGVVEGDEVSVHYDPMIAKLVVWGEDRYTALSRLVDALSEFNVVGLPTNVQFLSNLATHPEFEKGNVHTDFLDEHQSEIFPNIELTVEDLCQATLAIILEEELDGIRSVAESGDPFSPFRPGMTSPRLNHNLLRMVHLRREGKEITVIVTYLGAGHYRMAVSISEKELEVTGNLTRVMNHTSKESVSLLRALVDGNVKVIRVVQDESDIHLFSKGRYLKLTQPEPRFRGNLIQGSVDGSGGSAPMPGVVEKVCVEEGQVVATGDPLMVIIAMKMEYVIKATSPGIVEKILHWPGESIPKDAILVKVKPAEE